MGLAHNGHDAANESRPTLNRIASGVGATGNALGLTSMALGGAGAFGMRNLALGSIGEIAAAGGMTGAATAAGAAGGVLSAAAGGYAAGTVLDRGVGEFIGGYMGPQQRTGRGVDGGNESVEDHRRLSERIADGTHTGIGDRLALRLAHILPVALGGDGYH